MATAVDNRVKLVENDTAEALDVEFQGVDITGYECVLHIGYPSCALRKTAILTDPTNGKFQFQFDYGDLRYGSYAGEIRITDTTGKELTIGDFTFDIQKRIKG